MLEAVYETLKFVYVRVIDNVINQKQNRDWLPAICALCGGGALIAADFAFIGGGGGGQWF